MINKEELKLGNYISDTHNRILRVEEVKQTGVRCLYCGEQNTDQPFMRNSLFSYEDLNGIALTANTLKQFGFHEYQNDQLIQVGNLCYLRIDIANEETSINPETWRGAAANIWNHVKEMHQLQNLMFCLTGKDFKIKIQ